MQKLAWRMQAAAAGMSDATGRKLQESACIFLWSGKNTNVESLDIKKHEQLYIWISALSFFSNYEWKIFWQSAPF